MPKGDGTTGLNSVSIFGTSNSKLAKGESSTVPGLVTSTNVPANSVTIISTDGGVGPFLGDGSSGVPGVDIRLLIDGAPPSNGGYRQIRFVGGNWSMQMAVELTPGPHTIEVKAANASTGVAGTPAHPSGLFPGPIIVSGGAGSGLQGTLTVTTLKR